MGCWLPLVKQMLPLLVELLAKARPEFVLQATQRPALLALMMQESVRKGMEPPEYRQFLQNQPAQAK